MMDEGTRTTTGPHRLAGKVWCYRHDGAVDPVHSVCCDYDCNNAAKCDATHYVIDLTPAEQPLPEKEQ